jgi:arylsulfatase A-like enzyme
MTNRTASLNRTIRRGLLAAAGSFLLAAPWCPAQTVKPQGRPNIILILADDLGFGDVACYSGGANTGAGRIQTPHIDRLAREGMRFTDAHSAAAICTPARLAVITGRSPLRSSWEGGVLKDDDPSFIPAGTTTLPGVLKAAGYRSMLAGKWHLGETLENGRVVAGPLTLGFDTFFDAHAQHAGADRVTRHRQADRWSLDACRVFLRERAGDQAPFYLQFCPRRPHDPYIHEQEWVGRGEVGDYGAAVMNLDAHVGELLADLDRLGLAENTLVIFTSDNGPESSKHDYGQGPYQIPEDADDRIRVIARREKFGHDSSGGWRGHKYQAYEAGHRVPFIVRWPRGVPAGTTNAGLIAHTDLLATFASIAGAGVEGGAEDSFDQSARFSNPAAPPVRRGGLFASGNRRKICIRREAWTLIDDGVKPELFDLSADAAQILDLAAQRPDLVADLRAWRKAVEADGKAAHAHP